MEWVRINKLKLHPDKMEVLLVDPDPGLGDGIMPVLDWIILP